MTSPFYSFYDTAVNGSTKQVDWKKLEQQFRIKDKRYPSSKQILHYYSQDFSNSALKGSRCKWHSMDKLLFLWVVVKYCELYNRCIHKLHKQDFEKFSEILQVPSELLEAKWVKLAKPYLRKSPWDKNEDMALQQLMAGELGGRWTEMALKLFDSGKSKILRTAKQVRERWVNYLDPTLKRDRWTEEEDQTLMAKIDEIGSKWSQLGKLFNRSENNVKNRYFSLVLKERREEIGNDEENEYLQSQKSSDEAKTSSKDKLDRECRYRILLPDEVPNTIKLICNN